MLEGTILLHVCVRIWPVEAWYSYMKLGIPFTRSQCRTFIQVIRNTGLEFGSHSYRLRELKKNTQKTF